MKNMKERAAEYGFGLDMTALSDGSYNYVITNPSKSVVVWGTHAYPECILKRLDDQVIIYLKQTGLTEPYGNPTP
jgi:hypothetical protein